MRVLITGGMGVIGSGVTTKFVHEGHRPVVMARHLDRNLIRPIEDKIDIELADVLDIPRIISILQKYEITHIVHTAALVGAMSNLNPPQSIHINVIGTLNILEAARLMKVRRVVYTSAKGVYGHIEGEYAHPTFNPLPEDYPKRPQRIYESAKLMGEHMGQFYKSTYGLEFAALRFGMTYGPGKTVRHGKMSVLSEIIEGGYAGRPVRIDQGGDQKEDILYNKPTTSARGRAIPSRISPMRSSGSSPRRTLRSGRGSIFLVDRPTITASTISRGLARTWDMHRSILSAQPSKTIWTP
jgi:UDP-glucose 4-epimerase